jgi:hypothetical protein
MESTAVTARAEGNNNDESSLDASSVSLSHHDSL